ncbi:MAG: DUF2975 domain-containing protein [Gemmatimonadaceae bacterium]
MTNRTDSLRLSRTVLRTLIKLNLLAGALILLLLLWTLIAPDFVMRALGAYGSASTLLGMRMIMVIGISSVPITHVVLSRLLQMVDTVSEGNAFIAQNARRLQIIAWAVLSLEVMHFIVVLIGKSVSTPSHPVHIDWNFSLTRWLAILLLFVLSRVFEEGTRMREDLEGTV